MHGIKEPVGGLCQQQIGAYVPELDEVISFEEVCMAIKSMKPCKSPGVDGISTEVYKALPDHLVPTANQNFQWNPGYRRISSKLVGRPHLSNL